MRLLRIPTLFVFATISNAAQAPGYRIAGTVIDHLSGRPLSGILVSIVPAGESAEPVAVLTSSDGHFSFPNVPDGKYSLSAERRGGGQQMYLQHGSFSTAIVTGPGLDSEHITFPLVVPASLSGIIIDSDGDPVPHASVFLIRQECFSGFRQFVNVRYTRTSESGAFHFAHLEPSRYYIAVQAHPWYAQHPDFVSPEPNAASNIPSELDVAYAVTYSGDTTDPDAATPIQLEEGKSAELRITMHTVPAVSLVVKTTGEEVHGLGGSLTVRAFGGILHPDWGMFGSPAAMQFSGVAPGRYELTVKIGSERILKTIDLASNTTLEVSKEQDPPKFTGRITLDGPGSVPGGGIMLRANNVTRYIGLPGADGSITFEPVPSGHYEALLYNAPGFYAKSVSLNGVKAADDFVDVPAPGGFELSVVADHVAAKKLEGIVEHDRKPVAAAMVLLIPEDLSRTSLVRRDQSDSDGSFSLPNVAPGRYRLVAIEGENDLAYRDPAVIKPYLAQGQPVNVEPGFNQRVKVEVAGR